jgi:predicted N-acyltransferase
VSANNSFKCRILNSIHVVSKEGWNNLLGKDATPFLRHEFLSALEDCACVGGNTGWQVAHLAIYASDDKNPIGLMPLYLKNHSYGEYVFDWSWAEAYQQHGLPYYPKALCAIPFTPVRGARLLVGESDHADEIRIQLIEQLKQLLIQNEISSAHILFAEQKTQELLLKQGFMARDAVQFHWKNHAYQNMEDFLSQLNMKRRKNIRKERSQVQSAGISFRHIDGPSATQEDWTFFYRCYANTYYEHRSSPYLSESFFQMLAQSMPENLHLILAYKNEQAIAASLLFVDRAGHTKTAYGRYWGALEHVPCLHFETAYYQAIEYCINHGIDVFEGGAQGQHKMARGFMPVKMQSAHWIKDPEFSKAVEHFLIRESSGIENYIDELAEHSPLKTSGATL